ncbi:MAG TPA: glycosyltransferase family 39 protein [Planctomycetota bacterium]|nr:glycosyltransferase family 39 protein [Planctomycetota bacterium]
MNGARGRRAGWICTWLGAFFLFAAVAHGNFETADAAFTMHAARALWKRGDSGLLTTEQGGELLGECVGAESIGKTGNHGRIGTNGRAYVWFPMGHVWLMVPFVVAGEWLNRCFPAAEARFRDTVAPGVPDSDVGRLFHYLLGNPVLTQGLISLLLPASCAATSVLLLFLLSRALGATPRDAAITTGAIALATQFFALGRETLSDGPGLCALLAMLWVVVRVHLGTTPRWLPLFGGMAAGATVLLRYGHALLLLPCALAIALACKRRRSWSELLWLLAGGLPFACLFFGVNMARFGNPLITGYPDAADWLQQPIWLGLCKLLVSAGRGILWLSPVLWLALPMALRAQRTPQLRWLAWVLFAIPMLLFASANGWQGGQCWGSRYVTPGVVVLLALVLPQAKPWLSWPRTWWLLCLFGVFANITSVVAPVRGVIQLAAQAVNAEIRHEVLAGRMRPELAARLDAADILSWRPRFSPLHANWSYAWRSHTGGFEDEQGAPRDGSANTIEPLFGIAAAEPGQGNAPARWEDRCGRHLWWRFWADLGGVSSWLFAVPALALALLLSFTGWRRLLATGSEV